MSTSISPYYIGPGVFIEIVDASIPSAPSGVLYPAMLGMGSKTRTKATPSTFFRDDNPAKLNPNMDVVTSDPVQVIALNATIEDENKQSYAIYDPVANTGCYQLDILTNSVDWTPAIAGISTDGTFPVGGVKYSVTYLVEKDATIEYLPKLFTRIGDLEGWYGPAKKATTVATGVAANGSANSFEDSLGTDFYAAGVRPGMYVYVTTMTGEIMVRVVLICDPTNPTVIVVATTAAGVFAPVPTGLTYAITDISINTISFGASVSFEKASDHLMVMGTQMPNSSSIEFQTALDNLKLQRPWVIVPMMGLSTSDTAKLGKIKAHVETMSGKMIGRRRVALIGGPVSMFSSISQYITDCQTIDNLLHSNRICYAAPTSVTRTIATATPALAGASEEAVVFDGSMIAAAVAGIMCNSLYDEGEPITRKTLTDVFDAIAYGTYTDLLDMEKDQIASKGTMVVEMDGATIRIRHALTTNMLTEVSQEIKFTRVADVFANDLQGMLDTSVVGTRNLGVVTDKIIESIVSTLGAGKIRLGAIVGIRNIHSQNYALDSREKDVSCEILPTPDVDWIAVTLGVATV